MKRRHNEDDVEVEDDLGVDDNDEEGWVGEADVDGEGDGEMIINVDFEFFNPKEEDYNGVRVLVQQLLVGDSLIRSKKRTTKRKRITTSSSSSSTTNATNGEYGGDDDDDEDEDDSMNMDELQQEVESTMVAINVAEIADYIVSKQQRIGTLIKVEGQDDAFGFLSVVHAQRHKDLSFIPYLKKRLTQKAPVELKERFAALWDADGSLGIILSGRIESIPPMLVPHLFSGFEAELEEANAEDRQNNRPVEFEFEHLLFFSHVFKETVTTSQKKRQRSANTSDELTTHVMPEDEILRQYSTLSFTYQVVDDEIIGLDGVFTKHRLVMVIPYLNFSAAVRAMQEFTPQQ